MATLAGLLRRLDPVDPDPATDAIHLRNYAATGDRDALAALVHRHGPVVYRVCRRLLRPDDVEDGFQATFLVLARRAGSVRKAGSVASWLVGVAGRVAREMRRAGRRRGSREGPLVGEVAGGVDADPGGLERVEHARLLHEELARLPDRLRGPVVVCLLQGRTSDEAAAEFGASPRTVRRRVEQARRLLRARLERRGVAPAVAAVLVAAADGGTAAVPAALVHRSVLALNDVLAGGASLPAVLAHGVVKAMSPRKALTLVGGAVVCLTALGLGLVSGQPVGAVPLRLLAVTSVPAAAPLPEGQRGPWYYYPTRLGDRLTYKGPDGDYDYIVTAVERKDGRLVVTTGRARPGQRVVPLAKVEVSEATLLVLGHAAAGPGDPAAVQWNMHTPPYTMFKAAARPGERWEYQSGMSPRAWCTVGRQEAVRVPAGEFHAIPVETKMETTSSGHVGSRCWLAPGVGAVKWETGAGDVVLRSFTPGKE